MRICIEYPYDHSVYSKMGHGYSQGGMIGWSQGKREKPDHSEAKSSPWGGGGVRPIKPLPSFVILTIASRDNCSTLQKKNQELLKDSQQVWQAWGPHCSWQMSL
jgi:hypothetical protein